MAKFNVISLETGGIRKTIEASNYDKAVDIAENLFNCCIGDEFIVETIAATDKARELQPRIIYGKEIL